MRVTACHAGFGNPGILADSLGKDHSLLRHRAFPRTDDAGDSPVRYSSWMVLGLAASRLRS
jgi:hypothetical protein